MRSKPAAVRDYTVARADPAICASDSLQGCIPLDSSIAHMEYILDTSVILRSPEVLARAKTHRLLIPSSVVDELLQRGRPEPRSMLSSLLSQAMEAGARVVAGPSDGLGVVAPTDLAAYRLDPTDMAIAATAMEIRKQQGNNSVSVITLDKGLGEFMAKQGIPWLSPEAFLELGTAQEADSKTLESANSIIRSQRKYIIVSAAAGASAALVGKGAYDNLAYLAATFPIWGTLFVILLVGIGLYWYRERYRLSYGVTEFLVGFMISGYVFYPSFDLRHLDLVHGIQLVGGLYAMVRGLDNVGKGVESTRLERLWRQWF